MNMFNVKDPTDRVEVLSAELLNKIFPEFQLWFARQIKTGEMQSNTILALNATVAMMISDVIDCIEPSKQKPCLSLMIEQINALVTDAIEMENNAKNHN